MIPGSYAHVWNDPHGCCAWLSDELRDNQITVTVRHIDPSLRVLRVTCAPLALTGDEPTYGPEEANIVILGSTVERIYAVPVNGDRRTWKHRYTYTTAAEVLRGAKVLPGKLCLWYPKDPEHLRWVWDNGIDTFIRKVQTHLFAEEYARRHDAEWPFEDVPHGELNDEGLPHPILTPELKVAS